MKRALFIVPPYVTTDRLTAQLFPMPYAAALLAGVLEADGWEVEIKDFLVPSQHHRTAKPDGWTGRHPPYLHWGHPFDDVRAWIAEHAPTFDVVGLCAGQCNVYPGAEFVASCVHDAGVPLVVGGPFVTTATEEACTRYRPAVAVVGEGEDVVVEAFERALAGETGVVLNGTKADVRALPLPAWHLVDLDAYPRFAGRRRGVVAVSRGCPWTCSFCSVWTVMSRRHRRLDHDGIVAQLEHLVVRHGVRYVCFVDDNLVISRDAWDTLRSALDTMRARHPKAMRGVRYYMEEGMEIRVAAMPGIVAEMVAYGFDNIALGLETANAARASAARKPYKDDDVAPAIDNCHAAGIVPKAFYIVGFPGDDIVTVCRDLVAFGRLGVSARPNNLKLYPGTDVTRAFVDAGHVALPYDWRRSSWHTPDTPTLTYDTITRLKTILGAIGFGADAFGLRPFAEPVARSVERINATKGYEAVYTDGVVRIEGGMFRETPYRHLAVLLALAGGAPGAEVTVTKDRSHGVVVATPTLAPVDDIQAAMVEALR